MKHFIAFSKSLIANYFAAPSMCVCAASRAKTLYKCYRLAEHFIRVDVISFTHWPIIGTTFFHVHTNTYFISFCIRTVAQAVCPYCHFVIIIIFCFYFLSLSLARFIYILLSCLAINSSRSYYLSYLVA